MPTNSTLKDIGDRIYAINLTIIGLKARRYFPENLADTALHPLLIAFPGTKSTPPNQGAEVRRFTRTWELILIVGTWLGGLPSETAQANAETWIEAVEETYLPRPRLELSGNTPLDAVLRCELGDDNGLVPYEETLAIVRWPLLITARKVYSILSL